MSTSSISTSPKSQPLVVPRPKVADKVSKARTKPSSRTTTEQLRDDKEMRSEPTESASQQELLEQLYADYWSL